ncbi:hypothetical protein NFC73_05115 [Pseudarthrobacter sp. RMG13]|uniref:Uncharacterized protein n=1 Tax=Pseudarthrobacter humi TaxID=2952523 RepID=A0ABT1LKZ6_9MICC|nr:MULTISPECIES: hypothetical protein [Pseudarthrobacter]MCP8999122.1 hypothetical protein [Pseudarthrobacter humi]QDG66137.1 hypothetical protein NIBR502772_07880 [Pseudarthrobacter sp. NIBRBAC000502772]
MDQRAFFPADPWGYVSYSGVTACRMGIQKIFSSALPGFAAIIMALLATTVLMESALSFLGAGPQRPFATRVP